MHFQVGRLLTDVEKINVIYNGAKYRQVPVRDLRVVGTGYAFEDNNYGAGNPVMMCVCRANVDGFWLPLAFIIHPANLAYFEHNLTVSFDEQPFDVAQFIDSNA